MCVCGVFSYKRNSEAWRYGLSRLRGRKEAMGAVGFMRAYAGVLPVPWGGTTAKRMAGRKKVTRWPRRNEWVRPPYSVLFLEVIRANAGRTATFPSCTSGPLASGEMRTAGSGAVGGSRRVLSAAAAGEGMMAGNVCVRAFVSGEDRCASGEAGGRGGLTQPDVRVPRGGLALQRFGRWRREGRMGVASRLRAGHGAS